MFFQEITPDTSGYMIAGFAIAFIVMGLYVFSLYLRNRNLNQDLSLLEEMERQSAQAEKAAAQPPLRSPTKGTGKGSGKK
jgi:hypothetical protein